MNNTIIAITRLRSPLHCQSSIFLVLVYVGGMFSAATQSNRVKTQFNRVKKLKMKGTFLLVSVDYQNFWEADFASCNCRVEIECSI